MVDQACQNPYTRIDTEVCPAQVIRVWEEVSNLIQYNLCLGRGTRIPGLLKVTYKLHKNEVGQKNVIVNRIPLMMISEDVSRKYYITSKKPPFNLDVSCCYFLYKLVIVMLEVEPLKIQRKFSFMPCHSYQRFLLTFLLLQLTPASRVTLWKSVYRK